MVRWYLNFAAMLGVCLSAALAVWPASAAEKGKWWQSAESGSSNGSGNSSAHRFSVPSKGKKPSTMPGQFKFGGGSSSSSAWKKLQGLKGSGGSASGGANSLPSNGLTLGKQHTGPLKLKQPMDFGQLAHGGQGSGNVLNGPARGNVGGFRSNLPAFDPNKISDAIKNGQFRPITGLGGAGGAGNGGNRVSPPAWIQDHLAPIVDGGLVQDFLDDMGIDPEVFNPPADGGDDQADPNPGDGNPRGDDPGDNNGGNPGDGGNGGPDGPHDDDCHDDHPFPWWPPIVIGGGGGGYCPPSANITVIEAVQPLPATVDLQLLDVRLVDAGDAARNLGPRYRLVFGNAGTVAAGNFRVLAMASQDGTPSVTAPAGMAEVAALAPGTVASADVRLPLAAELPSLGALIVAIDSATQIAETDEQNNVAVLDRAAIAAVEPTAVATP